MSKRTEFLNGVKAEIPMLIGVLPFGMIYGALALSAGMPPQAAQAMSAIVFAGSSQFVTTQMVGAPALVIILTIAIVNLRHLLYSASVAPYLQGLKPAWKWLLAYLLTDEAYAPTILRYEQGKNEPETTDHKHWFFLGAGLTLWTGWQTSTAIGIYLGTVIPATWSLDFTLAVTFIALVVPFLRDRAGVIAALTAGVVAVATVGMPLKLGLVSAALAGIAAGMLAERKR